MPTTNFNINSILNFLLGYREKHKKPRNGAKRASKNYGLHTCSSSLEEMTTHNQLVNTRQVVRLCQRKPNHPSIVRMHNAANTCS